MEDCTNVDYNQADTFPFKQDCPIVVYNQVQSCLNLKVTVPGCSLQPVQTCFHLNKSAWL